LMELGDDFFAAEEARLEAKKQKRNGESGKKRKGLVMRKRELKRTKNGGRQKRKEE